MPAGPVPTFADVLAARRRLAPHLRPTALHDYRALDELVGTSVLVKHENHQPTGAFKVRGGLNLVAQLSEDERRRGLIAASTGNHGQSVAYAARRFGVTARDLRARRGEPGQDGGHRRARRRARGGRRRLRRGAGARRGAGRASTATATCTRATSRT